MTEIIQPEYGDPVRLRPCPSWCSLTGHFAGMPPIRADDGFHHMGPEVMVSTVYRHSLDSPVSVVRLLVTSWVSRLDGEPQPARIELQLGTAEQKTDDYVELTPDQARALAAALSGMADIASRPEN